MLTSLLFSSLLFSSLLFSSLPSLHPFVLLGFASNLRNTVKNLRCKHIQKRKKKKEKKNPSLPITPLRVRWVGFSVENNCPTATVTARGEEGAEDSGDAYTSHTETQSPMGKTSKQS